MHRLGDAALAGAILVLDQATKALVRARLPLHSERHVLPGLSLSHGRNEGVVFGLLSDASLPLQAILLGAAGAVGTALLAFYWWRLPPERSLARGALALVLGGALGNLIDRVRFGAVTDFVHVYWGQWSWPDFNVADSAIVIGLVLLLF
jgi:signal peptidase II